jgi:hypothetical protein
VAERKGMDEEEITAVRRTREVLRVAKLFFIHNNIINCACVVIPAKAGIQKF